MRQYIDDLELIDPTYPIKALGKLGAIARDALPSLYVAKERTFAEHCHDEIHDLILTAIRNIENDDSLPRE